MINIEYPHRKVQHSINGELLQSLKQCANIKSLTEVDYFIKTEFRRLVPHSMAMWGIIEIDSGKIAHISNIDFPKDYVDCITKTNAGDNFIECSAFTLWSQTLETIEVDKQSLVSKSICAKYFQLAAPPGDDGVESVIIAGFPDLSNSKATVFCFTSKSANMLPILKDRVDLLIPFLHQAVVKQFLREHMSNKSKSKSILTSRETQMLKLIFDGLEYQDIADFVGISINTVRSHIQNIFMKLQVTNRTQALVKAITLGIIRMP